MLDRCIGYDQLIGFIRNNFVETLEEDNMLINLESFKILGFVSGMDDAKYLTKICNDQDNGDVNILQHTILKLHESS